MLAVRAPGKSSKDKNVSSCSLISLGLYGLERSKQQSNPFSIRRTVNRKSPFIRWCLMVEKCNKKNETLRNNKTKSIRNNKNSVLITHLRLRHIIIRGQPVSACG